MFLQTGNFARQSGDGVFVAPLLCVFELLLKLIDFLLNFFLVDRSLRVFFVLGFRVFGILRVGFGIFRVLDIALLRIFLKIVHQGTKMPGIALFFALGFGRELDRL